MWMQNIMSKVGSRSRHQSKSPSSSSEGKARRNPKSLFGGYRNKKHRSSHSKDRSFTEEESLNSEISSGAAWRVHNIRNEAPTQDEWWKGADDELDGQASNGCSDHRQAHFAQGMQTSSPRGDSNNDQVQFHNCGLETWEQARKEWKRQTVAAVPNKLNSPRRHELAKGLAKASNMRTYELPQRMALSDLIKTYQEIWCLPDRDN